MQRGFQLFRQTKCDFAAPFLDLPTVESLHHPGWSAMTFRRGQAMPRSRKAAHSVVDTHGAPVRGRLWQAEEPIP